LTNGFIINTKEQVEFYFDLEEDYQTNTTNNAITNNKRMKNQTKLPVPEHLTDKEKANLMVAWARTHNKWTRSGNNNITSGEWKIKPKRQKSSNSN
jgi:hypothetical protein